MVVALLALLVAVGGTAYATGEGKPLLGGQRNPGNDASKALTKETQIIASTSSYGTRQSNKSSNGGGAIYGCRSGAGGSAANNEPCIRANNLSSGYAFEFATTGTQGGLITTGNPSGSPFRTTATGVATGLNADQVDGKSATDFLGKAETAANSNLLGGSAPSAFFPANKVETFRVKLAFGQTQTLFSAGTLTFSAKCVQNGTDPEGAPTKDFVKMLVATSKDGGILTDGGGGGLNGANPTDFLNTGTDEADRALAWVSTTTGDSDADIEGNGDGYGMSAVDPDGAAVIFPDGWTGSVGLFGTDCLIAGFAIIP